MAEFKLGRIRFVWQGDWAADRIYVADDVVSFGGKSYICVKNHTSSAAFNTDFTDAIPKWEIVSDGTSWRGEWQAEVEYAPGDVVKYGANVYICENGHISATFEAPTYLGLEENLGDWTPFATSFDWKGDWTASTRYKINDLVRYGGYVYLCNTAHVSRATAVLGLEADQAKWSLFSDGLVYTGEWTTSTRYRVNDLIKYGGNIWICVTQHTSGNFETDGSNWETFIEGFQFEDSWNAISNYQIGDTVTYGGYVYVARTNNTNSQPTSNPLDWDVFTTGFKFQSDWAVLTSYKVGDVVRLGGTTYVAVADSVGETPPNETYWSRLNSGINWTRSTETFLQVQGTNAAGGSGSGARFDVVKSETVYTLTISTGFAGTGYALNDVITIAGASVGGTTPANNLTITVTGVSGGAITSVTHTGFSTTWKATATYYVGDVVIYGANSYIAIATHTAASGNRPDNDLTAQYWNLLTLGSEALALTTEGDLVYYGEQGPTRLPIGIDGQILRVTDGTPAWANYGLIDNVVYVGPLGTDRPAPASGLTIDQPWRSVRYAMDQIRQGYLNPQARDILQHNKEFMMKEVTAWIKYTYGVVITAATSGTQVFTTADTSNLSAGMPIVFDGTLGGVTEGTIYYVDSVVSSTTFRISTTQNSSIPLTLTSGSGYMKGNLAYDDTKCERDTGYIVDAVIYDVSRGGTLKTVTAANAYYTTAGNLYINSAFGSQKDQTVAANEYLKELIGKVLNNQKPINYQKLIDVAPEDQAVQIFDLNLTAEATALAKAASLMDIITTGIAAGSATAIPFATNPNTTVFIKTGTYNEVLPIIIPEYTACVGDELRTSVVQPQPAIPLLANDKDKTTGALNRIKSLVPDLMKNIQVTVSPGNTAPQQYINGYGGTTTATNRLNTGISVISDVLENGIDVANAYEYVLPTPTGGTGNAYTAGYADAAAQLVANKAFIQAEITAWIADQVLNETAPFTAAFTYDAVACERDVGYIVDALVYDLTYGGNLETTVAARSYFVDGTPVYGAGEKDEVLAAYAYLKSVVSDVILENAVTPSPNNGVTQDTSGDTGSAGAATAAENLVQEIYDTIDTDGTLATPVLPDTTWVASTLLKANTDISAASSAIQEAVIDYVNSNFGTFIYDSAKCRRDAGILQIGAAYDIGLNTNYNAIVNGLAYRRGMSVKVLEDQLTETVGAITEEGDLVEALVSDPTAITRNTNYWAEVIDIIENNTPNAIVYSDTGVTLKTTARTELQTNRQDIIDDVTAWIASNYPDFSYNITVCERDTGRIIDALSYDIQYGGNSAIYEATRAYFDGYSGVLPVAQRAVEAAAIAQLSTIAQGYMTGAVEQAQLDTLLTTTLIEALNAGSLSGLPTKTYPAYVWGGLDVDVDAILADTTVVPAVLQYITNTYSGFVYDHAKCSRDIGYILDGLRYDIMFGSDFRSLKSGMAYRRGITSTGVVIDNQLEATLGSIDFVRTEVREITTGTATVATLSELIRDILINQEEPTSFTLSDPTGYDTGFFNARRLIVANKTFIQDEVEAYLNTNYNAVWTGLTAGEQAAWLDDVGYSIDAVRYDLTYRGNLETIVAARSYYSNGLFVRPTDTKIATLAIQDRLAVIIDDIATGVTITRSSGNTTTQDTSGTAGSAGAGAFAADRINEIRNTIDIGDAPALIAPTLVWVDDALQTLKAVIDSRRSIIQAGAIDYINFMYPDLVYNEELCARDVGYIVDAMSYDIIFGSDFRSAKAGMSYLRGLTSTDVVLNNQLEPTIATINFIEEAFTQITTGVESKTGDTTYGLIAAARADDIKTCILSGLDGLPVVDMTKPNSVLVADPAFATATNTTGAVATYGFAADQLAANRTFIQVEIRKWLEDAANGYDDVWTSLTSGAQDRCIRDIGYIVDAVRYDLTYGGNTQSLVAGSAYYSKYASTISAPEIPATLAAFARLRVVVGQIIAETTVTKSTGNTETQDTTGTPGNAFAIEFAQDRVDDVIDWINNAVPNATIEVATAWASPERLAAYNQIVARRSEIVEDMVQWVEKFFQDITYDQDYCRRDAGLMVDAIARDLVTGSTFASVKAGMSYYRQLQSTAEVRSNEFLATVGAVNFLKHKVKHVATTTASGSTELIINDITATINGGARPAYKFKPTTDADATDVAAAAIIWENKAFIIEDVIAYLEAEYPSIEYSREKCSRDTGMLVDALRYDLTYGGSFATRQFAESYFLATQLVIDVNDKEATLAAYEWVKFLASELAQNTLGSPYAAQTTVLPKFRDINQATGDANSSLRVVSLVDSVKAIINDGSANLQLNIVDVTSNVFTAEFAHGLKFGDEIIVTSDSNGLVANEIYYVKTIPGATQFTLSEFYNGTIYPVLDTTAGFTVDVRNINPVTTSVNATIKQQATNLTGSVGAIQASITEYIAEYYPTLVYDEAKCSRDVGYIVEAVTWDMLLDTNYRTVIAALAYYRGAQADLVLGAQKNATVQSYRELKNLIASYITATPVVVGQDTVNIKRRVNKLMDIIINILDKGDGDTPEITGTINFYNDVETSKGVEILKANRNFLANEATAWVNNNFGGTTSGVDGAIPSVITFTGAHNFRVGDPIYFSVNLGSIVAGTTYFVSDVPATNTISIAATQGGTSLTLSNATGASIARYKFDEAACQRDMISYIDAIAYDLQYPGNHKGWRAAELYLNAVNGSERSDMYRVRNSTGVRNQTLNGLRGNLTEENEFGTRRPTAGAFVALDPGFGPNDTEAWITNKSPYIQNVTNFGTACVGNKIDGALHAGGNRSMVSNDFTQVLSDGIGVWCSGNNSLTELVSVFGYYTYSGYLADFGGRIRATNGNSSYGEYGVIAEGTDSGEIPLFAEVNNLSADAFIGEVPTDGSAVLRLEFSNAGRNYTNAAFAISGDGFNATAIADEFRDRGVFEVRLIDLDDGNGTGGADYVTAKNVAQGGDLVSITIAATDTALANAYNGMNIQLTAGTGVGQYARVLEFSNGSKVAKVYKDSVDSRPLFITSSTGNIITTDDTSQLYVNMPLYLGHLTTPGTDFGGLTYGSLYYVTSIPSNNTFTVSTSEGGANVVLTNDAAAEGPLMLAAGWDHCVPGTPIEAGLDLTTGYTIEPSMTFSAPGFTAAATTTNTATAYKAATYAGGRFVALQSGGTETTYSTDGGTWTQGGAVASANWVDVEFGGGFGATATAIVGGLGGSGAVLEAELGELNSIGLPGPTQIRRINVIDGGNGYTSPPTIAITPTSGGGGATAVCTVLNGVIQEVIVTSTGAGFGAAPTVTAETDKITKIVVNTYGSGYRSAPTVTLQGGGASTQATVIATLDNGGVFSIDFDVDVDDNPLVGEGYTSAPTVEIVDSSAKFVAIANGSTANARLALIDEANTNWTAGNALPNSNFTGLAFGDGVFVAVGGTGGAGGAATSTDGATWVSRTNVSLGAGSYADVAYGAGTFVAIATGTNATSTSTNGITWAAGGNMPATTTWSSIAYGNGRFVAIGLGVRNAAYSVDKGVTWYASPAGLPTTDNWSTVKYGQGLFFAVAEGTDVCATSPDGVTWTRHVLPASADWHALTFGNPNSVPTWVALTDTASTVAAAVKTGAKTIGRCDQADGSLNVTRIAEPGSGYPVGTVSATTSGDNTLTVDTTDNLILNQPIKFTGVSDSGLVDQTTYYIEEIVDSTTIKVSLVAGTGTPIVLETTEALTGTFRAAPIVTVTDPNSTVTSPVDPRQGDGVLANPTFTNRGTGYQTATAELGGDGYADLFQPSTFVAMRGLFDIPQPGSNIVFSNIPDTWFKLVAITNVIGDTGEYTATFQISPGLTVLQAPLDGSLVTTTNKYSQVRLTGHDFLYIGTGNKAKTNYPYVDITTALQERQQLGSGGGRVFYTSTDQDGNFNVGGLFGVQQSTGTATLNADAFNLAGLQSLQLNGIGLGIGSAIITQFSTDPFFTANSDAIVPTQRAIKSYITAQIGGGQSSLNVNTLTAGVVFIANDEITTTNGGQLNITAKMNFTGGVDGAPVALGFFLAR